MKVVTFDVWHVADAALAGSGSRVEGEYKRSIVTRIALEGQCSYADAARGERAELEKSHLCVLKQLQLLIVEFVKATVDLCSSRGARLTLTQNNISYIS